MHYETYESPLAGRYASDEMLRLFSDRTRYSTWRRLWVALARAEHNEGLPVSEAQVDELAAHTDDIDFEAVRLKERELRHDVMAHIHVYGDRCPGARSIIHLGATSCYVTDNADLIIYREALRHIRAGVEKAAGNLGAFAEKYKALPTLAYTHYQNAQPTTVGRRACLWMQELLLDIEEIDDALSAFRFLGCRGTTGTEASFMELYDGDTSKIDRMNSSIASEFGFDRLYEVSGQTYPRKLDSRIFAALSSVAQSAYKFASDMRLLQHDGLMEEPFEKSQVGSSAMAYKRNPMRSERICSLSRYVMTASLNGPLTASSQWFERTLDDSANRRISVPEAFLATDGVLRIMQNITEGIVVNERAIARALNGYLPFIATENILMEAVRHGGDRQTLHEHIRVHSMAAREAMMDGGACDLIARIASDPAFNMSEDEIKALIDPKAFIGRSVEQTERFLAAHPMKGSAGTKLEV